VHARFLIHDHDDKYGGGSDLVFEGDGMAAIRTPIAAPRANSHMERQIGSTRGECLDRLLILNRRHLERVLADWFEALQPGSASSWARSAYSDCALRPGCDVGTGEVRRETQWAPARVFACADAGRCVNPTRPMAANGSRLVWEPTLRPKLRLSRRLEGSVDRHQGVTVHLGPLKSMHL
jgi:hypothetical protein